MTEEVKVGLPNPFELGNVTIKSSRNDIDPEKLMSLDWARRTIKLVYELAKKKKDWDFEFTSARDVTVRKDGETLGFVGEHWHGSQTALYVRNERIDSKRSRGTGYHTQDVNKAAARVLKEFYAQTTNERVEKAAEAAYRTLQVKYRGASSENYRHNQKIDQARLEYARAEEVQFLMWLQKNNNITMLEHKNKMDECQLEMATINSVLEKVRDGKDTALVVLAGGKYIVKIRDNVQLYDDNTFPVELRAKLGMLKLVEDEQVIYGMGCRVTEDTFVLVLDEVKEDERVQE